jgi:Putative transposase/Transposase zinc-binding domain
VSEHRLEVADVFRKHEQEFLQRWGHTLSGQQLRAFRDICACRTAALGAHLEQCDHCPHQAIAYNSCRNRHCPKCQSTGRDKWLEARSAELLPVPYCHVVFTLPQELSSLALQNPRLIYGMLFRAVSETLLTIAADRRHLGAHIGFLAVLHTWNQKVLHHPHLHCVVPSGGLSPDRSQWMRCRRRFFLPVKVLGRLFRGKFLAFLGAAFQQKKLRLGGALTRLRKPAEFDRFLRQLRSVNWVVFAKRPFGGPDYVIRYLARYTHRVAIANGRLVEMHADQVTFRWRDSADGNQQKLMTLDAVEFIRR